MQKHIKLGWIGLGVMGEPMCHHLMTAGYPMSVSTRSKDKANRVLSDGAQWCDRPLDVAMQCDVIFTMVGSEQEVRDIFFSEVGLFATDINDKVFIDMGTTAPSLTLEIQQLAFEQGAQTIDAPVSGGDVGAKNASLSIMAGGDGECVIRSLSREL